MLMSFLSVWLLSLERTSEKKVEFNISRDTEGNGNLFYIVRFFSVNEASDADALWQLCTVVCWQVKSVAFPLIAVCLSVNLYQTKSHPLDISLDGCPLPRP